MKSKLMAAMVVACMMFYTETTDVTETCLACEQPRHAPCLVDLLAGSVEELRIYDSVDREDGTLTLREQRERILITFAHGDICTASISPEGGMLKTSIKLEHRYDDAEMRRAFCVRCYTSMSTLADANNSTRWVLADLYKCYEPRYYPLEVGNLQIRDYTLTLIQNNDVMDLQIAIERATFGEIR